ncbi:hypothetical protein [Romboutsia sp.]|uniref:hypothetical protein n=1 Tax=Romboutsia sp. TaxID=1965302 RepID=UPI002C554194|nr:hypothetical protein [Romboutsia sp.]HSQ88826.1 hypothetical protein [Romboutsia sp.]
MDIKQLNKANALNEEIRELDLFINSASKVWAGKLSIKDKIMRFISNSYGVIESKEFKMNTDIKNRVLDVLKEYKTELEEEFKSIT